MRIMQRMGSRVVVGLLLIGALASCAEDDGYVEVVADRSHLNAPTSSYVASVGAHQVETKMEGTGEEGRYRGKVADGDLLRYSTFTYFSPMQMARTTLTELRGAQAGDVIHLEGIHEPLPAGCVCEALQKSERGWPETYDAADARIFRVSNDHFYFDDAAMSFPSLDPVSITTISCPEQDFADLREKLALYSCP
jgi:hypothetical protein